MINDYYIIDGHCHIYPEKIAEKAATSVGNFYSEKPFCKGTVEELTEIGNRCGIDRYLIQSVATTEKQVKSINEFIAGIVAKQPERFIGFGTLHPNSENQSADLDKLQELGLIGVKLHPDIQNFKIDDYRCLKIYEECEKRGLPILIHTGDYRYDNSNPNRLIPILEIYKNLTVIGAHFGGWSIWEDASQALSKFDNLYVDCSSSLSYIDKETAVKIIKRYGADKVLFGTDYPLHSPENELKLFFELGLSPEDNKKILSENIKKLLKI